MAAIIKKYLRDPAVLLLLVVALALLVMVCVLGGRKRTEVTAVPTETRQPEAVQTSETVPEAVTGGLSAAADSVTLSAGKWDICVLDLQSGERAVVERGEASVSASLIKLFIMGAVYERFGDENGNIGELYESVSKMIRVSDNEAANELTLLLGSGSEAAGRLAVTRYAASIGCSDTVHNRLMLVSDGTENYTSARDCVHILELIYRGECVSRAASAEMMKILGEQYWSNGLDELPEDARIYHKTGNLTNKVCGEAGIIVRGDTAWVVSAICNYQPLEDEPPQTIAKLSRAIYDYMAERYE